MTSWSFYDSATGLFTGRRYSCDITDHLEANTPAGCAAIEGAHDPLSTRVDVSADPRVVVDYEPPPPSAEVVAAANRANRKALAIARIAELVAQQHQHVREHCLGFKSAAGKLRAIHDEVAALELHLK